MIKHYRSPISMVTLLICLCMGSLIALPMGYILGVSGLEMVGIELENDNLLEHVEFDEEFIIKIYGAASDDLMASKSPLTNLVFRDHLLVPCSPPPKHT